MQVCICVVAWVVGRYDHGVYAWRKRDLEREKKKKKTN
jgi:hypothetical protein